MLKQELAPRGVGIPVLQGEEEVKQMTPIETNFWADARDAGAILYPQWPACGYFLDFANPVAKVAIECDGYAYHLDRESDAKRQAVLEAAGWTIYRISGRECNMDYDEETHTESPGKRLLDRICDRHGIKRMSAGNGGWVSYGGSALQDGDFGEFN